MKLKYTKSKGDRIKYNYLWVDCFKPEDDEGGFWWIAFDKIHNGSNGKWIKYHERKNYDYFHISSAGPWLKSPKAFIRHINKHKKYLPKGTVFFMHSKWVGYSISYTI